MLNLVNAILRAAAEVGEDGLGKGGLTGYLVRLARMEPKQFARLLALVLPYQAGTWEDSLRQGRYKTVEEVWQELRARGLSPEVLRDIAAAEIERAKRAAVGDSGQPLTEECAGESSGCLRTTLGAACNEE